MKIQWFMCLATLALAHANPMRVERDATIDGDPEVTSFLTDIAGNVTTPKEALQKSMEVGKQIKKFVEQANKEIEQVYGQIAAITKGEANMTKTFIHDFNKVKTDLRKSRQELRILAQDTVTLTNDVKILLDPEIPGELNIHEVEAMLHSVKELLVRTKGQLTKARDQYNAAIAHLDSIQSTMKEKIVELDALGDENSAKYKKFAADVRGGVYGGCTAVTVGMIFADVFGCLGICSASATSACWAAAVPSVEASLANYREAVAEFKQRMEVVKENVEGLDSVIQNAITGLEFEIDVLGRWQSISGRLESKLEKKQYQAQMLAVSQRIRFALLSNVNELHNVAKEYLALPPQLFGDDADETQV